MNVDQLTRIRQRCNATAFPGTPLELFQTAHADRVFLLAKVDRLTRALANAEYHIDELAADLLGAEGEGDD